MNKALKTVTIVMVALLALSCSTTGRYLYYNEVQPEQNFSIEGTLPLVSIQLSGRTLSWSESSGNFTTTYTFRFDDANSFANMVFDYLPLQEMGIGVPKVLHDGKIRLSDYLDYKATINTDSYDWGLPVVDEQGQPDVMDPNILNCLNENVDSDYYLVLDGDIIQIRFANFFGLIPFTITYEFSAVVYNREGQKVVSRHYRRSLDKLPGPIYEAQSYYDGLEIALEKAKDEISADLKQLGASADTTSDPAAGDKI